MAWASTWGARPSWWLVDTQLQRGGRWLLSWFEVYCSWELSACGSPVIHRGKSKRQMVTTLATPADFRIALDLWHGRGGRGAWVFFVPSTSMCFLHFHWSQSWKKQLWRWKGLGSMKKRRLLFGSSKVPVVTLGTVLEGNLDEFWWWNAKCSLQGSKYSN